MQNLQMEMWNKEATDLESSQIALSRSIDGTF